MVTGNDMAPPEGRICLVCGQPAGADPFWITVYPNGVHSRCRDWSGVPFPYDHELSKLRRMYRDLGKLLASVARAGSALHRMQRGWPEGAADGTGEAERLLGEVQERLKRSGLHRLVYMK